MSQIILQLPEAIIIPTKLTLIQTYFLIGVILTVIDAAAEIINREQPIHDEKEITKKTYLFSYTVMLTLWPLMQYIKDRAIIKSGLDSKGETKSENSDELEYDHASDFILGEE